MNNVSGINLNLRCTSTSHPISLIRIRSVISVWIPLTHLSDAHLLPSSSFYSDWMHLFITSTTAYGSLIFWRSHIGSRVWKQSCCIKLIGLASKVSWKTFSFELYFGVSFVGGNLKSKSWIGCDLSKVCRVWFSKLKKGLKLPLTSWAIRLFGWREIGRTV